MTRRRLSTEGRGSPYLISLRQRDDAVIPPEHPFTIPSIAAGLDIRFESPVTFFVGENGSGKSTLLEAIAWQCGFGMQGGSRDHRFDDGHDGESLGRTLHLAWRQRSADGFFLRAETFFNFASHLESVGSTFGRYGGRSLHEKSHGEAFLSLFEHRFEDGIFLLDEPEAALSPQRQLAFLGIMHQLATPRAAQFIIATHSPILLAFPGATILSFDDGRIHPVRYEETDHYQLTKSFLEAPDRFFRHLFADGSPE